VEVFSLKDIATVAGVPVGHVERRVVAGDVSAADQWVVEEDAVRLIREIVAGRPAPNESPSFFAVVKSRQPRSVTGLLTSAGLHAVAVAALVVVSFSLLGAAKLEPTRRPFRSSSCISSRPARGVAAAGAA
jgi:hypothetical protein